MTQHNYKKTVNILVLSIIVLGLLVVPIGAKEIHVSNGVSLEYTAQNYTPVEKLVISDLSVAQQEPVVKTQSLMKTLGFEESKSTENTEVYSVAPISEALTSISDSKEKAAYKAKYASEYLQDIVGENTIYVDGILGGMLGADDMLWALGGV